VSAVIVFSGGLDSTVALTEATKLHDRVLAVSFNYGQRHRHRELAAARDIARQLGVTHHVVDLGCLAELLPGSSLTDLGIPVPHGHYAAESMQATVVPNRNMIMLSIAAGIAGAHGMEQVITAVHAGDHYVYPDCRPEFMASLDIALNLAFTTAQRPVLDAPYVQLTKAEIVSRGYAMGAPMDLSWSCYEGGARHCGRCGTCVERCSAFEDAGVHDPTLYEDPHYFRTVTEPEPSTTPSGTGGVAT
jgi:7-cyano-7-deazaguanine synthase